MSSFVPTNGDQRADFTINLDAIIADKMGARAKRVPRFVVNWLKRLIHQDWLNVFLRQEGDIVGQQWLDDCVKYVDMRYDIVGLDNLPRDGRLCTFVSNHPLGGIDGVVLGSILSREYDSRIKFLVNDLLMNLHGLAPYFVPINKTGSQSRDFPAMVDAAFRSPNHIIMFPAGLCSRRIGGRIQDLPWKKTFVSKSLETQRDVVPIHFGGQNSRFFYTLANISKRLGIKFNIAMLFLVDEMYKNRGKRFTIHIGKPIPWQTFADRQRNAAQWAAFVRDQVYSLPEA